MKRDETLVETRVVEEAAFDFTTLSQQPVSDRRAPDATGAATARLNGFDSRNQPLISDIPGVPGEIVGARSTVTLTAERIGCGVVVVFESGDVRRPIVIGVLQSPEAAPEHPPASGKTVAVEVDRDRLVLSAEYEIVLRCGSASITLTKAGKVLIQGAYVSTRSSGANRIKGGSVQIN